jgi:hypothetical protein
MLPPQFCDEIEPEKHKCKFCQRGVNEIVTDAGNYTKQQCIKEYMVLLNKLKEKKDIAKILVKGELVDGTGNPIKR